MLFSVVGIEVIAQSLKPVKLFSPCKHTQHCELLCPFSRSSNCELSGVSKVYTAMFKRTRHAKAQSESYRESDSFALNQNFLKNLFGTKRTISVDSNTILYYKLFRFFFLRFFYSSAVSVFDIKIKIECKGDQYIILWKLEITKSWVEATMMEDENAFTPTLCTALVSRDRWSKHVYQIASERRPKCEWSNCIL